MRLLLIERMEGIYAICKEAENKKPEKGNKKDKGEKLFAIEKTELPEGAVVGSKLKITDDGEIIIEA